MNPGSAALKAASVEEAKGLDMSESLPNKRHRPSHACARRGVACAGFVLLPAAVTKNVT